MSHLNLLGPNQSSHIRPSVHPSIRAGTPGGVAEVFRGATEGASSQLAPELLPAGDLGSQPSPHGSAHPVQQPIASLLAPLAGRGLAYI